MRGVAPSRAFAPHFSVMASEVVSSRVEKETTMSRIQAGPPPNAEYQVMAGTFVGDFGEVAADSPSPYLLKGQLPADEAAPYLATGQLERVEEQ